MKFLPIRLFRVMTVAGCKKSAAAFVEKNVHEGVDIRSMVSGKFVNALYL